MSISHSMIIQKDFVFIIWTPFMSTADTMSALRAFSSSGATYSAVGSFMMSAPSSRTTANTTPSTWKVMRHCSAPSMVVTTGLSSMVPPPKPMSMAPDVKPCLSGNHFSVALMTVLAPRPMPVPTSTPYMM